MSRRRACGVCEQPSSNINARGWCRACEQEFNVIHERTQDYGCPLVAGGALCPHPYICVSQHRCLCRAPTEAKTVARDTTESYTTNAEGKSCLL